MTTKKAEKEEKEEGEETDEEGGKDSGGGGSDGGSLEQHVRQLVREAMDALMGDRGESSRGGTRADDEEALFQRVKKAQEKIKADEEKEGRLKKVEEKVEKVLEKPPSRDGFGGKVSRFLWGGED